MTTWASSEFHDVLQHVVAFENLKTADFKYLLTNLDSEMDVDINDPNQLLTLLKSKMNENDTRTVTSLIQNIVVGTSLIDGDTRSYMLSMIEKAVTYIVLDQNGITNFTDAFKYSVDQIIAGLQEVEQLREENIQLTAICDHQEKQLMERKPDQSDMGLGLNDAGITRQRLEKHKTYLELIWKALESKSFVGGPKILENQLVQRGESDSTIIDGRPSVTDSTVTMPSVAKPPPPPPPPRKNLFIIELLTF